MVKFYNNIIDNEPMSNFTYLKKQVDNIPAGYFPSPDHLLISIATCFICYNRQNCCFNVFFKIPK